jgi:hypothetical protein
MFDGNFCFCHNKLRFELGNCTTLSIRNGFLVQGVVAGTFWNRVQLVPPLLILNSAGSPVPAPTSWIEVSCPDIVAAAAGPLEVPNRLKHEPMGTVQPPRPR